MGITHRHIAARHKEGGGYVTMCGSRRDPRGRNCARGPQSADSMTTL